MRHRLAIVVLLLSSGVGWAADLCTAIGYPPGGALSVPVMKALEAEGLYDGPVPPTTAPRPELEATLGAAMRRYAERHRVETLSQDRGNGQLIEDAVARDQVRQNRLEETKQVVQTHLGSVVVSHFHPKGNPDDGVHTRISFSGRAYVGLTGSCHPPLVAQRRGLPFPKLKVGVSSLDFHRERKQPFAVLSYEQVTKRILVVTPDGVWLASDRSL